MERSERKARRRAMIGILAVAMMLALLAIDGHSWFTVLGMLAWAGIALYQVVATIRAACEAERERRELDEREEWLREEG